MLFVEHDMDIVRRYTQRILAFYDGKVIADGDSATVLANPEVRRLVVGEPAPEEGRRHAEDRVARRLHQVGAHPARRGAPARAGAAGRAHRPQRRRQDHAHARHHGHPPRPPPAPSPSTARRMQGVPSYRRARGGMGYMPEDRRIIPQLSIEENVCLPAWAAGQSHPDERLRRIYELIPEVGAAGRTARGCSSPAASRSWPRWPAPS